MEYVTPPENVPPVTEPAFLLIQGAPVELVAEVAGARPATVLAYPAISLNTFTIKAETPHSKGIKTKFPTRVSRSICKDILVGNFFQ